jgi:hypothetical protein
MNITYLIGNGFDINLDLKTHYTDFYPEYTKTISPNKNIALLQQSIKKDYASWANMEENLGQITEKYTKVEDFIAAYIDINRALRRYLQKQVLPFNITDEIVSKIYKDIAQPESYLTPSEWNQFRTFKGRWLDERYISFITYNYTPTFEELSRYKGERINIGTDIQGRPSIISKIFHIHSSLEHDLILGVNDISQIANAEFRKNTDLTEILVKPITNTELGKEVDVSCKNTIRNSRIVCLFGVSLGNTDKMWWELLGERLLDPDFRIIYFAWNDKAIPFEHLRGKYVRHYKKILLDQTTLDEKVKEAISSQIFVAYNEQMLSIPKAMRHSKGVETMESNQT